MLSLIPTVSLGDVEGILSLIPPVSLVDVTLIDTVSLVDVQYTNINHSSTNDNTITHVFLQSVLQQNGVLAVNFVGYVKGEEAIGTHMVYSTLKDVFQHVVRHSYMYRVSRWCFGEKYQPYITFLQIVKSNNIGVFNIFLTTAGL